MVPGDDWTRTTPAAATSGHSTAATSPVSRVGPYWPGRHWCAPTAVGTGSSSRRPHIPGPPSGDPTPACPVLPTRHVGPTTETGGGGGRLSDVLWPARSLHHTGHHGVLQGLRVPG